MGSRLLLLLAVATALATAAFAPAGRSTPSAAAKRCFQRGLEVDPTQAGRIVIAVKMDPERVAREDAYTGEVEKDVPEPAEHAYDPEAEEELAELLGSALDRFIGDDARDRETRDMIHENAEEKKSYAQIARERNTTEAAASSPDIARPTQPSASASASPPLPPPDDGKK